MADGAAQGDGGHLPGAPDSSSAARRLLAVAAALLGLSGFLLYTLVLGEDHLERDRNAIVEDAVVIATPAVVSLLVAVLALVRARRR